MAERDCSHIDAQINNNSGSVLLELAILLPFILLLVGAIFDLANAIRVADIITQSARHAARSAAAQSMENQSDCPAFTDLATWQSCVDISTMTSGSIDHLTAQAACRYLELSGLSAQSWGVRAERDSASWSAQNQTNGELQHVMVEVSSPQGGNCLFCWQNMFSELLLSARVKFALQSGACTNISEQEDG